MILGWKPKGGRRKTVCYWKKLLREAGINWTDLAVRTGDRKKWKRRVKERMNTLNKWEKG